VNHDNTSRESPRVRFAMCYRPIKKGEGWEWLHGDELAVVVPNHIEPVPD